MQINNNFNRYSAPQFGMALKVNKGAGKFLEKYSMETLQKLEKAGDEMADFKHWDLEVNEYGLRIKSKEFANAYLDPRVNPSSMETRLGRFTIDTTYDGVMGPKGKPYNLTFVTEDSASAKAAYDKFSKLDYFDKHIELTKLLEQKSAKQTVQERIAAEQKAIKDGLIAKLMNKFGSKQAEI